MGCHPPGRVAVSAGVFAAAVVCPEGPVFRLALEPRRVAAERPVVEVGVVGAVAGVDQQPEAVPPVQVAVASVPEATPGADIARGPNPAEAFPGPDNLEAAADNRLAVRRRVAAGIPEGEPVAAVLVERVFAARQVRGEPWQPVSEQAGPA